MLWERGTKQQENVPLLIGLAAPCRDGMSFRSHDMRSQAIDPSLGRCSRGSIGLQTSAGVLLGFIYIYIYIYIYHQNAVE